MTYFVVYFRIVGLQRLADAEIVGAMEALYSSIESGLDEHDSFHSSLYGGFVLRPSEADPLQLAEHVRKHCVMAGVDLAIGVSLGPVELFNDLHGKNYVGTAINQAARLAFLDASDGRIGVLDADPNADQGTSVVGALKGRNGAANVFTPELMEGLVKKTRLFYRWFNPTDGFERRREWGKQRAPGTSARRENAHVLVYDIVGYSAMDDPAQLAFVREIGRLVVSGLGGARTSTKDLRRPEGRTSYSPGGDGGVVVFDGGSSNALVNVAELLAKEAHKNKVLLRIGLHSGEVALINGPGNSLLPVGVTILEADLFSGQPSAGSICVSFPFWSALDQPHRNQLADNGWRWSKTVRIFRSHASFVLERDESGQPLSSIPERSAPAPGDHDIVVLSAYPDCVVVQSTADLALTKTAPVYSLRRAMELAARKLGQYTTGTGKVLNFDPTYFVGSTSLVESRKHFREAVALMCRVPVVVFDVTDFEPAVLLLAGIRAAVRRGVTILSAGGGYVLGGMLDVPFNIKEASILAHSKDQHGSREAPSDLLRTRIFRALDAETDPGYADLPVYHPVRNLSETERRIVAAAEGVVVLCPFHPAYAECHWKDWLRNGLAHQLGMHDENRQLSQQALVPLVRRSHELPSPTLVSSAIYAALHTHTTCVADWTWCVPNVFFELGVRLAVAPDAQSTRTVNLIEQAFVDTMHKLTSENCSRVFKRGESSGLQVFKSADDPGLMRLIRIKEQFIAMLRLFHVPSYSVDPKKFDEEHFAGTCGADPAQKVSDGSICFADRVVKEWIISDLDLGSEPEASGVVAELISAAGKRSWSGTAGSTSLFKRDDLMNLRMECAFDGHLAAWLLASRKYGLSGILQEPNTHRRIKQAANSMKLDKARWDAMATGLKSEIDQFLRASDDEAPREGEI
jgi:class 3 adenylate cyclase